MTAYTAEAMKLEIELQAIGHNLGQLQLINQVLNSLLCACNVTCVAIRAQLGLTPRDKLNVNLVFNSLYATE
ncbi:hypothetical protein RUND412_001778, partial [Rhizina undulata]